MHVPEVKFQALTLTVYPNDATFTLDVFQVGDRRFFTSELA